MIEDTDHYAGVGYGASWSQPRVIVYDRRGVEPLVALVREWLARWG